MRNIEEQLRNWRESRNIKDFPKTIKEDLLGEIEEVKQALDNRDWNNYVEELADIAIFAFNGLGTMGIVYRQSKMNIEPSLNSLESYINNIRFEMPLQVVGILNIIITICEELVATKKYDFKKVVLEKIKLLNSREQNPVQAKLWAKNGASGKWERDKDQRKETLYVPSYGKCKI